MIDRIIQTRILSVSEKFPAIVITGPRQSGKTTLIKNVFPTYRYFSFEDPDIRLFAESDPRGFLNNAGDNFIIDEVQRIPEIFSYLQAITDNNNKVSIILSGSQSFLLNEKISQTLAGRVAIFKLLPFSIQELINGGIMTSNVNEQMFKGFYPRLFNNNIAPMDFYPNYVETYIERDVRQLRNIGDLNNFIRFTKLCANRTGQILNISSLSNDAGISVNTAKSWLSVLEASYIIYFLHSFYKNYNKRLIKMPKMYFYDTGLVCSLLNIENSSQLENFYLKGNIFENLVVTEFVKSRLNRGLKPNLFFWRDSKGVEVDLIIEKADAEIPVEIKMTQTLSASNFKGLNYYKKISKNTKPGYLVYGGDENITQTDNNYIGWKNIEGFME